MSNNNILVIGIAGGTGSGKSTLTKQLVNHFGDQITVLKHDDYYKAHDEMTYEERTHLNYDHPNAFDTDLMLQHLRQLKKGEPINCPIYDYTVHNRSRNFQVIYPTNVIIVEGILIFENKELCKEMDIKIFVFFFIILSPFLCLNFSCLQSAYRQPTDHLLGEKMF